MNEAGIMITAAECPKCGQNSYFPSQEYHGPDGDGMIAVDHLMKCDKCGHTEKIDIPGD